MAGRNDNIRQTVKMCKENERKNNNKQLLVELIECGQTGQACPELELQRAVGMPHQKIEFGLEMSEKRCGKYLSHFAETTPGTQ